MAARDPHILVLGAGSVGKRHMGNLLQLGVRRISLMDPRADRRDEAAAELPVQGRFATLDAALAQGAYDAVVIASPPKFHVEQCARSGGLGLPVFMEKPLCIGLEEAENLARDLGENAAKVLMGYTYRWWPPLQEFRRRLPELGRIWHAKLVMSAHLADWHPWEPYQEFFMASKELGGGALLDESHFLDLMLWFFGAPKAVFGDVGKRSDLEIDSDDNVDMLAFYGGGKRVSIHLDLYGRPHEKYIAVTGENGTLQWSFEPNRIRFGGGMAQDWDEVVFEYERNDMFVGAMAEFLEIVAGRAQPSCGLADGIAVMQVIEAVRQSAALGRVVTLGEGGAVRC